MTDHNRDSNEDYGQRNDEEIQKEMRQAFGDETPTEEDLAMLHSAQMYVKLIENLPDYSATTNWDTALLIAQQTEGFEALVEGLMQAVQLVRTQTYSDPDELEAFCVQFIALLDFFPALVVGLCHTKHSVFANKQG